MAIDLAVGLLLIYTLFLICLGRVGYRKAQGAEHFINGGRRFGMGYVFFLVAAMWGVGNAQ